MELLFEGKISVKAILENEKREKMELIMEDGKRNKDFGYVFHLAKSKNVPITTLSKEKIQELAISHTHGGLLLKASPRKHAPLPSYKQKGFLCMIDGVEDPYNLGSICRTLYAAGCNGLILPQRNWDLAEPTILKASAGAYEHLDLFWIQKEEELIRYLNKHSIPLILAHRKQAQSLYNYHFPENFCLGLGGALRGINSKLATASAQNLFLEYGRECRYALDTASTVSAFSFEIVRQRRNTLCDSIVTNW